MVAAAAAAGAFARGPLYGKASVRALAKGRVRARFTRSLARTPAEFRAGTNREVENLRWRARALEIPPACFRFSLTGDLVRNCSVRKGDALPPVCASQQGVCARARARPPTGTNLVDSRRHTVMDQRIVSAINARSRIGIAIGGELRNATVRFLRSRSKIARRSPSSKRKVVRGTSDRYDEN